MQALWLLTLHSRVAAAAVFLAVTGFCHTDLLVLVLTIASHRLPDLEHETFGAR